MESIFNHYVKIDLPRYGFGTFYLDKVEGGYAQSLPLLIHFIIHANGIYKELLTKSQYANLVKLINEDKNCIYKIDDDGPDFNEENVELLKQLEYDSCKFVLFKLKQKGYKLNEAFIDMFAIDNSDELFFSRILLNDNIDDKILKEKYLKIIILELNEIINGLLNYSELDELIIDDSIKKQNHNDTDMFLRFGFDKLTDIPIEDYDEVIKAIQIKPLNLRHFSFKVRDSEKIVELALEKDGTAVEYISERLKQNKEIVKIALKQNGNAFMFVSEYFGDDEELFLFALRNQGQIFSSMLIGDEYVGILFFASDRLKDSDDLVIEAISSGENFEFASSRLKSDKIFIRNLIAAISKKFKEKNEAYIIEENCDYSEDDTIDYFADDKHVIYYNVFTNIDNSLKKDKAFIIELINLDPYLIEVIPKKYRINKTNTNM